MGVDSNIPVVYSSEKPGKVKLLPLDENLAEQAEEINLNLDKNSSAFTLRNEASRKSLWSVNCEPSSAEHDFAQKFPSTVASWLCCLGFRYSSQARVDTRHPSIYIVLELDVHEFRCFLAGIMSDIQNCAVAHQ